MPGSPASFPFAMALPVSRPAANEALPRSVRIFQLAAALDAYETRMTRLLEKGFDSTDYVEAESAVREVRTCGVGIPELAVPALELCLAHAEVIALLWWVQADGGTDTAQVPDTRLRRQRACDALRSLCAQALKASGT